MYMYIIGRAGLDYQAQITEVIHIQYSYQMTY